MSQYKVVAPLVQLKIRDETGALVFQHFYAGAPVPASVDAESLRRHLEDKLVAEFGSPEAAVGVPAGTPLPTMPPNELPTESTRAGQPLPPFSDGLLEAAGDLPADEPGDDVPDVEEPPAGDGDGPAVPASGKPRGNASEKSWQEFHATQLQAQGVPEEDARVQASAMSRDDLRALYAE